MNLSIVIPNHNRVEALPLTLDALSRQTYPAEQFEVIVVDQASTDGSRELVNSYATPFSLRLVSQEEKYGISIGRNGGVEAALTPWVILLDADIIADPGLVQAHADLHAQSREPILGCGRLLPYKPSYKTFIEQAADPDAGLDRGAQPGDVPFWDAFGGHLSFSVQTFELVGSFKPELKGAEDTDFAYRATCQGIGIKNCVNAIGYHNHSRSLAEHRERAYIYWRIIPTFLGMHPELRGKIPGISELEPLKWGNEPFAVSLSKTRAAFWANRIIRAGLYDYLEWAEKRRALPRATKFCYYRLMLGEMRAGAMDGNKALKQGGK
jgi:GT2 family glycosyltransferase